MLEKIKEIIAEELNIEQEITAETSFKDDLDADSLDLMDLVMKVEDEFGVEITSDDLVHINTVGDIIKYLEANK